MQASQPVSVRSECTDIAAEVVVEGPAPPVEMNNPPDDTLATDTITGDAWSQTDVGVPFDIMKFMFDDEAIYYYTGLENYTKVMFVLSTLGHAAYNLSYYAHTCENLTVPNQFFLVLIKLHVHVPNFQLSRMFAISVNSVSNIFITWINFMALQWREINIMPSREMTSFHMPDDYVRKFPRTRIIIDGMECPIMKPKTLALNKQLSHHTKTAIHSRFWLAALQVELSTLYLQHIVAQSVTAS